MNKAQYLTLLEHAQTDPNILGFFLVGSRGKGFEAPSSDYDPVMVVVNEKIKRYARKYPSSKYADLMVFSLEEFERYAAWGTSTAWDRYDFAHITVPLDKTNGRIQSLVAEKAKIPRKQREPFVHNALEVYLNEFFRSVKSSVRKNRVGQKFHAALSVISLIDAVFALEGRVRPFYDYLSWELEHAPLLRLPNKIPSEFVKSISRILTTGSVFEQENLFCRMSDMFSRHGFRHVFDEWDKEMRWVKPYCKVGKK